MSRDTHEMPTILGPSSTSSFCRKSMANLLASVLSIALTTLASTTASASRRLLALRLLICSRSSSALSAVISGEPRSRPKPRWVAPTLNGARFLI